MGNDSELVLHLWETFKDVIPAGKREDTVTKMLKLFGDWGFDLEELAEEIQGEDKYLDAALEHYREEDEDSEDDEAEYDE